MENKINLNRNYVGFEYRHAHNGAIYVDSEEGKYTRFHFENPIGGGV